jgi:hypothetical protein
VTGAFYRWPDDTTKQPDLPDGYRLPKGTTMADVRRVDQELLASEDGQPDTEVEAGEGAPGIVEARFAGGPLDGQTRRLSEAPEHLKAWKHRQASVVRIDDVNLQRSLWDLFVYDRTLSGPNFASYELRGDPHPGSDEQGER